MVGLALGLGAPAGFGLLRRLLARPRPTLRAELKDQRLAYGYTSVATPLVFSLFGRLLGRREDRRRASERRLEQLREEFVAVVAHDLRNPIQAILLRLELMQRGARDGEAVVATQLLTQLERSGQRLSQMVDDLLDATRIEASRLSVSPEPVCLAPAVHLILEQMRPTLGSHRVEVRLEGSVPLVRVDPARLAQIVTNLVDNAAKYGAGEAPIVVRLRPERRGAALSVEDQGPGIAPEALPRLFDRFYQARRARELKSGLGLGLYIVKGLVEAHHGRIEVDSELGRGSRFTVWLPAYA